MRLFKRQRQSDQPARTKLLREMLELAYNRPFTNEEVHDAAVAADELFIVATEPGKALASPATPRQFLFAIAVMKSGLGPSVRNSIRTIAASHQARGK